MSGCSLRDNRRTDGAIMSVQQRGQISKWVPCTGMPPQEALCFEAVPEDGTRDMIYVARPTPKDVLPEFGISPFRRGALPNNNEVNNFEILVDPDQTSEWKPLTKKFNPKTFRALPANLEWNNEPNKYIGRVNWKSGDGTVGMILFQRPVWVLQYILPPKYKQHRFVALDGSINDTFTCEVLCFK